MSAKIKTQNATVNSKLASLQLLLQEKELIFKTRDNKWYNMEDNVKAILQSEKTVTVDIGGKKFTTLEKTFLNAKDSLFSYLILNKATTDEIIYIDRSPKHFSLILNFLRTGNLNIKNLNEEELKELKLEAIYYEIESIYNKLGGKPKSKQILKNNNNKIKALSISGAYSYNNANITSNTLEDLINKEDLSKGVSCDTNGWIEVELEEEQEISEIEISGLTGDTSVWYSGNGVSSKIQTSLQGKEYVDVGKIPSTFTNKVIKLNLEKTKCKFLKFIASPLLGLGYLNII